MSARRYFTVLVVAACGTGLAGPVFAQQRPPARPSAMSAAPKADPQERARYEIAVMESVLETAVQRGGLLMTRQWRSAAPEMLLMGGTARARGFRLDGYGVLFVVDVPALSRSIVWTWRMLDRDSGGTEAAVQSIRKLISGVSDPVQRKQLEQDIRRLEVQVAPYSKLVDPNVQAADSGRQTGAGATVVSQPGVQRAAPPVEMMADPNEAYTTVVKDALIDAMLDYSKALQVGGDESLTVAARDNSVRSLAGDDEGESMTIMIRIKGSDLQALHAGRITRDEARKRVEVKEY